VLVIFVNLGLRPIARFIQAQPIGTTELLNRYTIAVVCRQDGEAQVRALLLQAMVGANMLFHELNSHNVEGTDRVEVCATITAPRRRDEALEQIVGRLSLEAQVTAARWSYAATVG
jgi:putative Mg2+ transporter-C (MgtC) family protein